MSYKQPFTHVVDFLNLAGGTGVSYTDFEFKIDPQHHFEFIKLMHVATSNIANLKWYNATTGRYYTQPQVDLRAFSGTAFSGITANGFKPAILPAPIKVSAGSEMVLSAADKSGSTNTIRLGLHGNYLFGGSAPWEGRQKERWDIPINFGTVGANQSATKTIVLENKAGFLISKLTGIRSGSCLVYIMSEKRPWMSRACHFDNMFGNGQFGNVLTSPKWITEEQTITVNVMDLSGSANTISMVLTGERVYA